jgi:hypothetical protein
MRWACALACVAALSASAAAGGLNQTPGRLQHSYGARGIQPVSLTAVVSAKGSLRRGVGAVSAEPSGDGPGTYAVVFDRDISNCVYVATVGEIDDVGSQPAASASVVGLNGNPSGVYVATSTIKGRYKKLPFHLDVAC